MIERLTTAQAATVRKAFREAYAADNHAAAVAKFYTKYQDLYGISRETLLAAVEVDRARRASEYETQKQAHDLERKANTEKNRERRQEREQQRGVTVTERLTTAQAATVRKAFREAYAAENHTAAIAKFYTKYQDLYGISRETLRAAVEVDRARRASEYETQKQAHDLERKANTEKNRKREQERRRKQERADEKTKRKHKASAVEHRTRVWRRTPSPAR